MFAAAILATLAATDETCSPMFETTPVLRYFNVRGRGEAIRLAFADNGIAFEDASFSGDDWGKDKEDGLKAKWTASGLIAFGQVPLLEIDGLKLVQSQAILRYLGRKVGWYAGAKLACACMLALMPRCHAAMLVLAGLADQFSHRVVSR